MNRLYVFMFMCLISSIVFAQNKCKVALVIGNASYDKSPLRNPLNDADDVSYKFKTLGFDVISAKDCRTKRDMRKVLDDFCKKASNAEAGVFYYSGHGMQLSNEGGNYLIPINAEMTSEADVSEECLSLNYVLNKMDESGINMKIAIIDACRDNPFRTWHRGGSKGLSTPGAVPFGTFIAFAASANDVAADGKDRNSPFTNAFLSALNGKNLEIDNVFKEVKRIVKENTNGGQRPWTSNDLSEHFYFSTQKQSIANDMEKEFITCPSCNGSGLMCKLCEGKGHLTQEDIVRINKRNLNNVPNPGKKVLGQIAAELSTKLHNAYKQNEPVGFNIKGVTFNMLYVEGGSFTMGGTVDQGDDVYEYTKPVHSVSLDSYLIGETEVTQALWEVVMGYNPSNNKGAENPVECVNWNDCQVFINKLNSLTGRNFRLPTEAEWEYACRGGNKNKGYKYSGSNDANKVAWSSENSSNSSHQVKAKQPNELGLYDMSGNVWEWCSDWYGDYSVLPQTNPTGATTGSERVARSGSWAHDNGHCRASARGLDAPDGKGTDVGFRIVLSN